MDSEEQNEYRTYVRGAATYILLGQQNPPITASDLARIYNLSLAVVSEDIDAIVQSERRKAGGVFELNP